MSPVLGVWALGPKPRAASSGPAQLDALPHSTATRRLQKARTSPRTPEWLRLRRAGVIRGHSRFGARLTIATAARSGQNPCQSVFIRGSPFSSGGFGGARALQRPDRSRLPWAIFFRVFSPFSLSLVTSAATAAIRGHSWFGKGSLLTIATAARFFGGFPLCHDRCASNTKGRFAMS